MLAKLQTDTLEDSANFINLGQKTEQQFTSLSLGRLHASAWRNYPEKYKFFGLQINASDETIVYRRVNFDMLELLAYIGGVGVVLFLMAQCVVTSCARTSLNGKLGNRLYTWVPPPSLMNDSKREDSKLDLLDNTLYRR